MKIIKIPAVGGCPTTLQTVFGGFAIEENVVVALMGDDTFMEDGFEVIEETDHRYAEYRDKLTPTEAPVVPTLDEKIDLLGQMVVELYLKDGEA